MKKRKVPHMPIVPPEDGIERHKAYTRLNPSGHKEFVAADDEETLNELNELAGSLNECAEEMIWNYVREHLPDEILDRPDTDEKIDAAIGRGEGPDIILKMFKESISFGGHLATGGGAGSPEQPQTHEAGEDVNNFRTKTIRGIGPRNKYIAGQNGDGLDYGSTHNESFTGTGAIAISPGGYDLVDDDEDDEDDEENNQNSEDELQTENSMTRRNDVLANNINKLLNEWEPSFKSGEYSPGDYKMPSPTGNGVVDRKLKKDKVGSYDTNTRNAGKEWPRKHKDTAAMCDVDDDGTEHKSQGGHESTHGDAKDGHQSELGHNWPKQPKNSGGSLETFEGSRWSDGGTLKSGSGQDEFDNKGRPQKMPKTGPITGTSGPQNGQPSEGWSPQNIGIMMEGDFDLQSLFNNYSRKYEMVCVEDFQALCNAHGVGVSLDESSLLSLMEANREFIFYHGEDANGPYWCPTAFSEGKPFPEDKKGSGRQRPDPHWRLNMHNAAPPSDRVSYTDDDDSSDDNSDSDDDDYPMESRRRTRRRIVEGENRRPFGKTISELQIRSAEEESRPYGDSGENARRPAGDPDFGSSPGGGIDDYDDSSLDDSDEMPYEQMLDQGSDFGLEDGPQDDFGLEDGPQDDFGLEGGSTNDFDYGTEGSCPECGALSTGEESCPECGAMSMGSEESGYGSNDGSRAAGPMGTPEDVDLEDWEDNASQREQYDESDRIRRPGASINGGARRPSRPGAHGWGSGNSDGGAPGSPFNQRGMGMESRIVNSPKIMERLHNFMSSARRILENNREFSPQYIGEALRYSWTFHANGVNPQTTPSKVKATIEGLAKRFPSFAMVMESGDDAMGSSEGSAIGTGGAPKNSSHLPKTDTEMKDEGEPLGADQENDLDGPPEIKGTAKGMDGKGSVAQAVKENVSRLSKHVQKAIKEGANSLRGKYRVGFSVVVNEGKSKNRTGFRLRLSEALADAEEILQFHNAKDVELEAAFSDSKGTVVLKHNVPLLTIKPRGVLTSEGAAIFRFQRNAEKFANELVSEGVTCRVTGHNWGSAVKAKTTKSIAESAFKSLRLKKK